MGYLDDAEDIFGDIVALKNRQKYQDALVVQTQRNANEELKIKNYDKLAAQRDFLLNEKIEEGEMAVRIVNIAFEDLRKNGLDLEGEVVPKDPEMAKALAVKHKVIKILKAAANELYRNEFKMELEKNFRQAYQNQADQMTESAKRESSGTPEEKERAVKNLVQKIQDSYPSDVFNSLQKSWKIWCIECTASHDHVFTEGDVTTLLRHSSMKKDIEEMTYDISRFGFMWPKFEDHVQVIQLADVVRRYVQSRLKEGQGKG